MQINRLLISQLTTIKKIPNEVNHAVRVIFNYSGMINNPPKPLSHKDLIINPLLKYLVNLTHRLTIHYSSLLTSKLTSDKRQTIYEM